MTLCDKCGKEEATTEVDLIATQFPEPDESVTRSDYGLMLCDSCAKPIIELLEKK